MVLKSLPLILSVKCNNWRMNDKDSAEADAEFVRVRKRALERDKHQCRFCGFKAPKWQEVHHLNDDHADNRLENLVTACPFCHMVQHIGLAGKNEEAVLIYLPEVPQATLHHIVRTALVARYVGDLSKVTPTASGRTMSEAVRMHIEIGEIGRATMASLRSREAVAEQMIGSSDPAEVGTALHTLPEEAYARRGESLAGIRLLPLGKRRRGAEDIMNQHIASWLDPGGPYSALRPGHSWVGLLQQITAG